MGAKYEALNHSPRHGSDHLYGGKIWSLKSSTPARFWPSAICLFPDVWQSRDEAAAASALQRWAVFALLWRAADAGNLGQSDLCFQIEEFWVLEHSQGSAKIMEKLGSLTFQVQTWVTLIQKLIQLNDAFWANLDVPFPPDQKIAHLITAVDCQPMFDGGILINVLGQLKVTIIRQSSSIQYFLRL